MEEEIWNGTVGKMEETTGEHVPIETEGRELRKWMNGTTKKCPLDLLGVVTCQNQCQCSDGFRNQTCVLKYAWDVSNQR